VVNKENPATICAQISLCPAAAADKIPLVPLKVKMNKAAKRDAQGSFCSICEMVVTVRDGFFLVTSARPLFLLTST